MGLEGWGVGGWCGVYCRGRGQEKGEEGLGGGLDILQRCKP